MCGSSHLVHQPGHSCFQILAAPQGMEQALGSPVRLDILALDGELQARDLYGKVLDICTQGMPTPQHSNHG